MEAFAACVAAYGVPPIGSDRITSANREHIRNLLTASGMSSDKARAMTIAQLREAYIQTAPHTETTTTTTQEPEPMATNIEIDWPRAKRDEAPRQAPVAAPQGAPAAGTHAAQLAALLAEMTKSSAAPVDEDMVRRIVGEAVENATMPRPLAITINETPRGKMDAVRHMRTETLLQIVAQNIPAYIVGPAGSGKTTACEQVAAALDLVFYLQGAVSGAHELLGFKDAHGNYNSTPFRAAFEHGGLICMDEIDAGDPAAILVMNSALANGVMAFPDQDAPVKRSEKFRLIAAANTFGTGRSREYVGRNQMDAATLDRFAFLDWPYDEALERQLAGNLEWTRRVQSVRASVAQLSMRHVVSPRASIMGAKLIASGMPQQQVENLTIWKGLSLEDVTRIQAGA